MSGIRLKRHPQGRELKAYLDTLPPAARARWWRDNRGWVDAGKPGPTPTLSSMRRANVRRPWTALDERELQKWHARTRRSRQSEIEDEARLLNLKVIEGGGGIRPPKRGTCR